MKTLSMIYMWFQILYIALPVVAGIIRAIWSGSTDILRGIMSFTILPVGIVGYGLVFTQFFVPSILLLFGMGVVVLISVFHTKNQRIVFPSVIVLYYIAEIVCCVSHMNGIIGDIDKKSLILTDINVLIIDGIGITLGILYFSFWMIRRKRLRCLDVLR